MSNVRKTQERTWFLKGQVAQSMGEYLETLERHAEAREEYQQAIENYEHVVNTSSDFPMAQQNKIVLQEKLKKLPTQQYSTEVYQLDRFLSSIQEQSQKVVLKKTVDLSQWLQNIVEDGWQTIEQILVPPEPSFAYAYALRGGDIDTLIEEIYNNPDEESRKQAALRLGAVEKATPEILTALIHLIQTTQYEETRWSAAESLWRLDPNCEEGGIRRVKDLRTQIEECTVALMVAVLPKTDNTIAVLLRIYSIGEQRHLPPHLALIVLDEAGNKFLTAEARELDQGLSDHYIQLKFCGLPQEKFAVKVILNNTEITEEFLL